mmetsp:Transcript_4353/g.16408  ORF Transcript_4353/g.16408 Transcript_4353/m.16408 type:complete len:277 (-) Transcript_4353:3641-4471(-)
MKRRSFLSTPLHLKTSQRPHSSQVTFFQYMKEMQSSIRHDMLLDPTSKILDLSPPTEQEKRDVEDIPVLTNVWYSVTDRYLLPYLLEHRPLLLEREIEGQEFDMKQFNGFTRRFELYAQRVQIDFSLMAYATRNEDFFKGMPLTLPQLEDDVYMVQKWERIMMKRFDSEMLRRERGEEPTNVDADKADETEDLVHKLMHNVIREHTNEAQKTSSEDFRTNYINNLFKYVVIDYFHMDFFSKHHLRWRMKAFERIGKHTEDVVDEEDEFGNPKDDQF